MTDEFKGYVDSLDVTKLQDGVLIRGSQNVLIEDKSKIKLRGGYTLDGAADSTGSNNGIDGVTRFLDREGNERHLRSGNEKLEYRYSGSYYTLLDSLTSTDFCFAKNDFWNNGELVVEKLFTNGTANIYSWTGAVTTFASATSNTITKQGTDTWAEAGFLQGNFGQCEVRIISLTGMTGESITITTGGTAYTFTAGTDFTVGSDIPTTAQNLADAIEEENNNLTAFALFEDVVVTPTGTEGITAFTTSDAANFTVPTLPARKVVIDGTEYTYTGGEDTTTLTGVSPNPSTPGYSAGDPVAQAVTVYASSDLLGVGDSQTWDIIESFNNEVYIGSEKSRIVMKSLVNDYTDYRFRDPRRVKEGARLTLGANARAFAQLNDNLIIFAGTDHIYRVRFSVSSDLSNETVNVAEVRVAPNQGTISHKSLIATGDSIVYVTNDKTIRVIDQSIVNKATQNRKQALEEEAESRISDLVQKTLDGYTMTNASVFVNKRSLYFAFPDEGRVMIYDLKDKLWQPPQVLPISFLTTIDGDLYGHARAKVETYKMFTGTSDGPDLLPIDAHARMSYDNYGARYWTKVFNNLFVEGYMSRSTELGVDLYYDYEGYTAIVGKTIAPTTANFYGGEVEGELGGDPLGEVPLGGDGSEGLPKFIEELGTTNQQFVELSVDFNTYDADAQWEIIAYGASAQGTSTGIIKSKK